MAIFKCKTLCHTKSGYKLLSAISHSFMIWLSFFFFFPLHSCNREQTFIIDRYFLHKSIVIGPVEFRLRLLYTDRHIFQSSIINFLIEAGLIAQYGCDLIVDNRFISVRSAVKLQKYLYPCCYMFWIMHGLMCYSVIISLICDLSK